MDENQTKHRLNFPAIQPRSSVLKRTIEFIPVIKSRRYNLLKIK